MSWLISRWLFFPCTSLLMFEGSATNYNTKMENVGCSPMQRIVVKRAHYGNFNNGAPKIKLSVSPNKGFIQIREGSMWRKVDEKNWDKQRQKMLCKHLGFEETDENVLGTREVWNKKQIVTGDFICYNTQSGGTSCCVHLEPSITSSILSIDDMPYVICKICNNPLGLQNRTTFPDSAFSGSGARIHRIYSYARFSSVGWCAWNPETAYLMIDLQQQYHITRVVTMGDKSQRKWSEPYSLKYSYDKTLVDGSSAVRIVGNQNRYQASTMTLDIYNVRYIKIQSTGIKDFCLRIELCGQVQTPVFDVVVTPGSFSTRVSWKLHGPKRSSYITHFYTYFDRKYMKKIYRKKHGDPELELDNLKPNTSYRLSIWAIDGSSQKSKVVVERFNTLEAAFSGPPVNIVLKSRGKQSLDISWKAPSDDSIHIGVLIGYRVCFSTRNNTPECSTTMSNTYTLYNLRPSTKYFVTVAAGTLVGYGNNSLITSKLTNGEPVNPVSASYYSFSVYIPKPAEYIKIVMVIVQIATSNPTPSEDIETNELKPHNLSIQEQPYVAVHMRTDVLPLTFAVGDGKEYISENEKYLNHPLKPNSNYIMFLRFFESKDSYYSTQWSNSVKTLVKPPVEYVDNQTFEVQSSNNKIRVDLIVPLVIVSFCFLFALGVIVYQHINQRRILKKHKQSSHKFQTSKHADQNKRFDAIQESTDHYESIECVKTGAKRLNENDVHTYAIPDETFARGEQNGCQSVPARSAGQEPSNYMSLKSNRETENFYHPLQPSTPSADRN